MQESVTYAADNYQRYQGLKLVNRFNVLCYYRLTQAMDSHDVSRYYPSLEAALKRITAKTLVIGIESDVLYPIEEQIFLQQQIRERIFCPLPVNLGMMAFCWNMRKLRMP